MTVELSPEVVEESIAMLELGVTVAVMEIEEGLELEIDVVAVLWGGGLCTGGTIGDVVFRAGHPEGSASRRTGQ